MISMIYSYDKKTLDMLDLLPEEIIIILCEVKKMHNRKNLIENLKKQCDNYPFKLKIIQKQEKSAAGNNRYIGTDNATTNIVIFQDYFFCSRSIILKLKLQ